MTLFNGSWASPRRRLRPQRLRPHPRPHPRLFRGPLLPAATAQVGHIVKLTAPDGPCVVPFIFMLLCLPNDSMYYLKGHSGMGGLSTCLQRTSDALSVLQRSLVMQKCVKH